ncbi:MAG: polyprenyl synthetase family protein [Acidobacteriota bacterium]
MIDSTLQPQTRAEAARLAGFLDDVRRDAEATLDALVPNPEISPSSIHEAMRYSLFAGGKRIRPALVVMTAELFAVERRHALVGGAALEMIHTYSLIHDDLPALDDDDLRRGKPSNHRRFGEATAILAGDALLTLGLTTLAAAPDDLPEAVRARATALVGRAIGTLGMIGGQVDDLEAEARPPDDPGAALDAIHRRKTGDLLATCLRLAGVYAEVDAATDGALAELGMHLGLMFQIADDILDVEGATEALGKTAGKDAAARKLTYPSLYGLDESKRLLARHRERALALAHALPAAGGLLPALARYLATRKT